MKHLRILLGLGLITAVNLLLLWHLIAAAAPTAGVTRHVALGGTNAPSDCANPNQPCGSVVYAVRQAEVGDTVLIAAGTYTEEVQITIGRSITIEGAGYAQTVITTRELNNPMLSSNPSSGQVTIRKLTLQAAPQNGINNNGRLVLDQVHTIKHKRTGIYNSPQGILTMTNSVVAQNSGTNVAGGLISFGQATIRNSLFAYNEIPTAYGGGLHNQGKMELENVTFAYNRATSGTAISNSGMLTMTNTTIAENSRMEVLNSASAVTNYNYLAVRNSLIVNNGPNGQCDGSKPVVSLGHNLENHHTCNFTKTGDQQNIYPALGSLGAHGGSNGVAAFRLPTNSVAIDAGNPTVCPTTDARGMKRPFDGNNDGTPRCDIGAFEKQENAIFLPFIIR